MVRIRAWADLALFQRPEITTDKCSYDMITPSAARGLMECIYWHPGMIWRIDRIFVLNPIRFVNLGVHGPISIMALHDVNYVIEAHFDMSQNAAPSDNPGKFADIIKRRIQRSEFYKSPYFGSKEYPAQVEPYSNRNIKTAYQGIKDLGYMLYDFDYSYSEPHPMFFRVALRDGVLDIRKRPKVFI